MKIYCGDIDFLYKSMINQLDLTEHSYMMPYTEFKHAIEHESIVICKNSIFMLNIGVLSNRVKSLMRGELKPMVIDFLNNTATLN
jgi:hypothetical protein